MVAALAITQSYSEPKRILNHDIMGCTAEGVTGNYLYSGRALGMTEPGDIIQLHPDLKSQWPYICAHYERIGLSFTREVLWDVVHRKLAEHPEREISVFYFGDSEQAVRPDDAWFEIVEFINSKNNFMALAEQLGVPVPQTLCFPDVGAITDDYIERLPYPCYLKASVSVSGVGIYRCADQSAFRDGLTHFGSGIPVQAQAEVNTDIFLNLQYQVAPKGLERLAATEQVLKGFAHQGNRYPARQSPWEVVEPMAHWLYEHGMKGIFAFDVAVEEKGERIGYLAIECNPRFNGASYPTMIASKLGLGHWIAKTFSTRYRSLADIDLSGIEYNLQTNQGVILVNWGPVLVGKLLFLIAGPPRVQDELALALARRL